MATSTNADNAFGSANPHALAAILEASETRRIIAATDIFDLAGTKLWARNQPVSASLQDDIRNAGGTWVDREVQVDGNWTSSRKPADLPAFNLEFIAALGRVQAGAQAVPRMGLAD